MRNRFAQRGFTFIELCLGLLITTLVMGALAAFSLAMASAWNQAENSQGLTTLGNQAVLRLQAQVRNAKFLGYCRSGSSDGSAAGAAVFLWVEDIARSGVKDGIIQGDEVALIEHDTVNHQLLLYPSGTPDAAGNWTSNMFFNSSAIMDTFKVGRSSHPIARNVYGAVFETSGTSETALNPSLKFALKFQMSNETGPGHAVGRSSQQFVQYGTATLRAPLPSP